MFLLMVVNDFNVESISDLASKADSILIVNAHAVLTFSVSLKLLQSFRRRATYILK